MNESGAIETDELEVDERDALDRGVFGDERAERLVVSIVQRAEAAELVLGDGEHVVGVRPVGTGPEPFESDFGPEGLQAARGFRRAPGVDRDDLHHPPLPTDPPDLSGTGQGREAAHHNVGAELEAVGEVGFVGDADLEHPEDGLGPRLFDRDGPLGLAHRPELPYGRHGLWIDERSHEVDEPERRGLDHPEEVGQAWIDLPRKPAGGREPVYTGAGSHGDDRCVALLVPEEPGGEAGLDRIGREEPVRRSAVEPGERGGDVDSGAGRDPHQLGRGGPPPAALPAIDDVGAVAEAPAERDLGAIPAQRANEFRGRDFDVHLAG